MVDSIGRKPRFLMYDKWKESSLRLRIRRSQGHGKTKHFSIRENKGNKIDVLTYHRYTIQHFLITIMRCIYMYKHKKAKRIGCSKCMYQLLFKCRFSKGGITHKGGVVNLRHQTPQGQAKPGTPQWWNLAENINWTFVRKGVRWWYINSNILKGLQGRKYPASWTIEQQITLEMAWLTWFRSYSIC